MIVSNIIQQLKSYAPVFEGRVAGGAEYEAVETTTVLALPAAFVIPLSQDGGDNDSLNGYRQIVTEKFSVIVAFDNRADSRGQATGTDAYATLTTALHAALLNWQMPPSGIRGLRYRGCALVRQDRARAWYRYDYDSEFLLDETDGYQLTGDPLTEIDITESPYLPFVVQVPQDNP